MSHLWFLNPRTGQWDYRGATTSSEIFLRIQDGRSQGVKEFYVLKA